ncbi:MAG: sulfite exporter TauE/SafE family protein [Alphaproteobacteria bacterium]|nr:sulfite exporter TauE/SafE family protein [Alphaproteobacteria bacterium]
MEMNPADGQFLGMVGINVWSFIGLNASALFSAFVASIAGTAGGLILIGLMALVFPPALLIPVHTIVQLGAAVSLGTSRWRYMLWDKVLPFVVGTVIGAAIGGQIFIGLSESVLLFVLGVSILILCWVPKLAQFGPEKGRFVFVGFVVTFLGVFISATGTLLAAFTAVVAPDRRNHIAMVGILMSIVHIAKLIAFGLLGVSFGSYVPLMATMIAMSFLGTWIGKHAMDRIPERVFRIGFQVLLTLLGLRLIWLAADASFNLN